MLRSCSPKNEKLCRKNFAMFYLHLSEVNTSELFMLCVHAYNMSVHVGVAGGGEEIPFFRLWSHLNF